jgi:hypothetical protein
LIHWNWQTNTRSDTYSCEPVDTGIQVNGITVTTRRDSSVEAGPVPLDFLGKIFEDILGKDTAEKGMGVVAFATAAFGYTTGLPPGPFNNIAIDVNYLNSIKNQEGDILLSPDKKDNGAWVAPTPYNVNANALKDWIDNGTSPGFLETMTLNFLNGVADSVYNALQAALAKNSQNYDGVQGWLIILPVVDTLKYVGSGPLVPPYFQPVILTSIDKKGNPKGIFFQLYDGPVTLPGTNPGGLPSQIFTMPKLVEVPLPESK